VDDRPDPEVPVLYPPPANVRVADVGYWPQLGFATVELNWNDPLLAESCTMFETESTAGTWLASYLPVLGVPGSYCFRVYVGNAFGRSDFSDRACIRLEAAPPGASEAHADYATPYCVGILTSGD
jgi:hypothetical protein